MRKLAKGIRLHYTAEPVRPLSREETLNAQNLSRKVTSTDKKLIVFQPISYGEKMNNIGKSAKEFFLSCLYDEKSILFNIRLTIEVIFLQYCDFSIVMRIIV